jgi:hypothetical protein
VVTGSPSGFAADAEPRNDDARVLLGAEPPVRIEMQQCNNIPREIAGAGFATDGLPNPRYNAESVFAPTA